MTYYHVVIRKKGDEANRSFSFFFNLTLEEVGEEIITPIANQQQINCKGQVIQAQEIDTYHITETQDKAVDVLNNEKKKRSYLGKAGAFIAVKSPGVLYNEWVIINSGKNVTNLLKKKFIQKIPEDFNRLVSDKAENPANFAKSKVFDVFICYKRFSAEEMAHTLRSALKDYDITAFIDTIEIPKEYEFTEKWWQYRDQAIVSCGTFLMLVTAGFEKSKEIAKEIKIARDNHKTIMFFRWSKLSTEMLIDLGDEIFNTKDLQQIPFDSSGMLVRLFFDNYSQDEQNVQKLTLPNATLEADPVKLVHPLVRYGVTQQINNSTEKWDLPRVGFTFRSWHPEPIKAKVKARVILGGEDLGMEKGEVRNGKYLGYYNGKTDWNLNPYNVIFGNFSIPPKCATSKETLSIEVTVSIEDQQGHTFEYLPVAFTFMRDSNSWFYEPASF
jgi:hypothetical protein